MGHSGTQGEIHVKTEMETGVTPPQAKQCQGQPAATRNQERGWTKFSVRVSSRNQPIALRPLASRTGREYIFVVLSVVLTCSDLLWQHWR